MAIFMQRRESHIPFTLLLTYGFLSVVIQSLLAANVTLASTTFRIITYNVQFLPEPVSSQNKRPQPEYRAGRIAEEVSPFDLVALQEMFHDRHRLTLMGRLRTAWHNKLQALYSPTPKGFYTSGGCLLIIGCRCGTSPRWCSPITASLRITVYEPTVLPPKVRLALIAPSQEEPDNPIDVYVTHLEARADHLRPKQYAQIADFIRKTNDPTRPFLLLGDLNTKGQPEYQQDSQSQYAELLNGCPPRDQRAAWTTCGPYYTAMAVGGTTEQESIRLANGSIT